jgi:two-component system phosphate regulon response regulator PhoB
MLAVPRVLIVDDDADTLRLYGFALRMFGFDVTAAGSAHEALRAVAVRAPSIVVTDLAMPGMDGIEFCRVLKSSAETRDIPVLAVSGQAIDSMKAEARAAGCRDVLMKPCDPATLFDAITKMLDE